MEDLSEDYIVSNKILYYNGGRQFHVYFLIYNDMVVYVGQASNGAKTRMVAHVRDKLFTHYYFIECDSYENMDNLEKYYIKKFCPFYNTSENDEPSIPPMTYTKSNNVLMLNAGGYAKIILDTQRGKIIDKRTDEQIGFIYNKVGYIVIKDKKVILKCSNGEMSVIDFGKMYYLDFLSGKVSGERTDFQHLKTLEDYYIYARIMGHDLDWIKHVTQKTEYKLPFELFVHLVNLCTLTLVNPSQYIKTPKKRKDYYLGDKNNSGNINYGGLIGTPQQIRNYYRKKNGRN